MARDTKKSLRNQVMYQVFVRNFSEEGTFEKVRERLDDIQALGVDIIWFMPIHPIGKEKRKGSLGSPYAISDYRAVNPEFGTLDDFKRLVDDIHRRGMKCIIDVVYNHTSPDSVLRFAHPEWFYHKADGSFGNRVGDWSDIIDLDYAQTALWDYQIETLQYWAEIVDGFRCDVAPLVPLAFWLKAREEVAKVNGGCLWLAESVEPIFITEMRERGYTALSDSELYQAFDVCYDYDIYDDFRFYFEGRSPLEKYAEAVSRQEAIYPDNYVKLRFLENHDRPRARSFIPNRTALENWTAFIFFQKGLTLIYNGQEVGAQHYPTLFDKDTVSWYNGENIDLAPLMARLAEIKKDPFFADSTYRVTTENERFIIASHKRNKRKSAGIFSADGKPGTVNVPLPDGEYVNLIDGKTAAVKDGRLLSDGRPIIITGENTDKRII